MIARLLDPVERFSEILFGLIMVLTFTGTISAAEGGHAEIRTILIGAVGCNLAWGIVDGIMYLLGVMGERGGGLLALRAVRSTADAEKARRIIGDALPPIVTSVLRTEDLERIRVELKKMPDPPSRPRLRKDDFLAALSVGILVFVSTFPVVLPFLILKGNSLRALRVSNAVAIVMLFWTGRMLAKHAGYPTWRLGLEMVAIGLILVGLTMALGG